ncbi:MAG: C13 family peptidase [Candidatus Thorarchaeota archaeon]
MSKKKKSKNKGSRPTALLLIAVLLLATNAATVYYFMVMDESVPIADVPIPLANIVGENIQDYIGKTATVIGYYIIAAGNHILVTNPMIYFNNSLSFDNHIVLVGTIPETMEDHLGLQIAVTGPLEIVDTSDGTAGMGAESFFDITFEITVPGIYDDARMVPYPEFDLQDWAFEEYDPSAEKYAVLYSGGIKPGKDHFRYWNDIIYMYFILQMHGYQSENIYVIYKDGVGEDTFTPVHYPATHTSLDTVFGLLDEEMGRADTLFFYTTNHGGGGGISVWGPMDSGGALTHSQVSAWLDAITCRNMIIIMEQCVSGKFISHATESLSAVNRVIMTACKDDESSYACDDEGNWDEFVYHFMCALVGIQWNGDDIDVDADFNNDGLVSMREAFVWAALKDSRDETPWYNDDGTNVGYNVGQVIFGSGPWYGDTVFL